MQNMFGFIFWNVTLQVLSWPAVSKDITMTKSSQNEKEKKGGKDKQVIKFPLTHTYALNSVINQSVDLFNRL